MHIIVGRLSAIYSGRGETNLPDYERIVMLKSDGTVSIHTDKGFKPVNYMASKSTLTETKNVNSERVWTFETKKEKLIITFHEIYDEVDIELGVSDPGHDSKDKTEHQLQGWLLENLSLLEPNVVALEREYQTGAGPVDLFGRVIGEIIIDENFKDKKTPTTFDNTYAAIEVKRIANMTAVGQVLRYVDALRETHPENTYVGLLVAVEFKAKTVEIAARKNVKCILVPEDWFTLNFDDFDNDPKEQI